MTRMLFYSYIKNDEVKRALYIMAREEDNIQPCK